MPKKVILLVEDNPDDLELALLALQASGMESETVVARDGQEALDFSKFTESVRPVGQYWLGLNEVPWTCQRA